jgi:uncharacterized membrane protein YphA (DoxX/SURF4 family)
MNPTYLLLGLLAGVVVLVAISARLCRNSADGGLNSLSRWLLVGLRLVIGWHFLVEGLDKLHSPTWSSEAYLRESTGPLAPYFRQLAGDRLVDKLTVGADGSFPTELETEWSSYLDAFSNFYGLDADHAAAAKNVYDQAKAGTLTWLTSAKQEVTIPSSLPPSYVEELTIAERLQRHDALEAKVRAIEADIPKYGKELFTNYKNAKSDLSKWRADLKKDIDRQFQQFKKDLRDGVLLPILQETAPEAYRANLTPIAYRVNFAALGASTVGLMANPQGQGHLAAAVGAVSDRFKGFASLVARAKENEWLASVQGVYHQIRLDQAKNQSVTLSPQAVKIFLYAYERKQGEPSGDEIVPIKPSRPMKAWTLLDWSDAIVKYGLIIVGGCLLAGFLTRTACLAGAGFLLMFFLAMPPLPGWPENPRAEGHYLYINKNVIEMFALLVLATMRSGRWAGVDGLLQFFRPGRWRSATASGNLK